MSDTIVKLEETFDICIPFIILVLSIFQLTNVIQVVEQTMPIVYGALALVQAIFKIWGITIRASVEYKQALGKK
jgi:hypothetical protein